MLSVQVFDTIVNHSLFAAFTLYGGYGSDRTGKRVLFPAGRQVMVKQNAFGRCVNALVEYDDKSRINYTFKRDIARLSAYDENGKQLKTLTFNY